MWLSAVLAFFLACLVTWYLVPLLIAVAHKLQIVDHPDGKLKQHARPTPFLGGVALYMGFVIALALLFPFENRMFFLLVGCTLLLFIGLIDDLVALKPFQKFFGQMIAALCFLKGGFYLKELFLLASSSNIAWFCWILLSYFWILTVINAFNLIDIRDGLATVVSLVSACCFFIMAVATGQSALMVLLAAYGGAATGFLWFNRPPAQVYLGDAGSLFMGGLLAVVPFMIPWGTYQSWGFLAPVTLLAVPLLEVSMLILIRTWNKIPFYQGSPHHFSIYLKQRGWNIYHILTFSVAQSFLFGTLGLAFALGKIPVETFLFAVTLLVGGWIWSVFCLKK